MNDLLDSFILEKQVCGLSNATLDTYKIHVSSMIRLTPTLSPNDFTKQIYNSYIANLQNKGMKDVTITSYCRSIRAFLYYCMDEGYIPRFKVTLPKFQKTIKQVYTDSELEKLLKKPNLNDCTFTEYKIWLLENIILSTGLRISSLLNIKISDIDFSDNSFNVSTTKNKDPTKVYFNRILANIIEEYLSYRGGEEDGYLICTDHGTKISKRTIQGSVRRYNNSRGVEKTSIHLFRHTFAKNAVLAGMDVFTLMRMMQHSDLQTTLNYVKILNVDAKRSCEVYNPQKQFDVNKKQIKPKGSNPQ